jgi:DNA helicase-2/ATP-dependent DNA helicase PcrA
MGESPLAADTDWTEVNAVNILTTHSSKGLEFPVVFLINLVGERFPSRQRSEQIPIPESLIKEILPVGDFHLEEERRLFYVGMTRAKERLFLTAADYYGEAKREKKLSPFIFEALGEGVSTGVSQETGKQLSFLDYKPLGIEMVEEKRKVKIDYLSYSQIDTFKICPLHYKLKYIYGLPTPQSASQSFGTTIHATMKTFYEKIIAGEKPTEKLIHKCFDESWVDDGYLTKAQKDKFIDKGKIYLSGYLKEGFNPKLLPVTMEQMFNVPLIPSNKKGRSVRIGGRMDAIYQYSDGSIEIVDYKTGANIPSQKEVDKNLQLSFYALAATKIRENPFGIIPEKIKLTLYFLDEQEKISTTRTMEQLLEAEKEILEIRDNIEKSEFKCSGHIFCQNCEYNLFCREVNS